MLTALRIENFAIIDGLEVRFASGLNVLTGETGAGKSILVEALNLVLGGRASSDLIRTSAEEAAVEALFEGPEIAARLVECGLPSSNELLVRRVVQRSGRSRVWVNGALSTVALLGQLTRGLVDVSGQHEHVSLLDPQLHLTLLDAWAGLQGELDEYRVRYHRLRSALEQRSSLALDDAERARRTDYLAFQIEEIDRVAPVAGEDEALAAERRRLGSAGKLKAVADEAERGLYSGDGSVLETLGRLVTRVGEAAALDATLEPMLQPLRSAKLELEEAARALGIYSHQIDADPGRLAEVDERLEALRRLCRKHGGDLEAVLQRRDAMRADLDGIERHAERLQQLDVECAAAQEAALEQARVLSERREEAAGRFARAVESELARLGMEKTKFRVALERAVVSPALSSGGASFRVLATGEHTGDGRAGATGAAGTTGATGATGAAAMASSAVRGGCALDIAATLGPRGGDACELLLAPNPGEPPKALAKIASGGELSRVMLAIKRALARIDPVPTYLFDEVDSGIGGAVAEIVGRLLKEVAQQRQVLCITHLAQIAAFADHHFSVEKRIESGRTVSSVKRLEEKARTREIARMLAGVELTDSALTYAGELIAGARSVAGASPPRRSVRRTTGARQRASA